MKATKLKAFKAWACVEDDGGVPVQNGACAIYYPTRPTEWHPSHYVRVVIRDARDDEATKLKRENARLRRALSTARNKMIVGEYGDACKAIARAFERKGRAK